MKRKDLVPMGVGFVAAITAGSVAEGLAQTISVWFILMMLYCIGVFDGMYNEANKEGIDDRGTTG